MPLIDAIGKSSSNMSAHVMENLRQFSPNVEIYSVNEAFLCLAEHQQVIAELVAADTSATLVQLCE